MTQHRDVLDLWLDDYFAGQLMRGESGAVEFVYDDEYRHRKGATPLSVSMPLHRSGHGPDMVMPWLSNLLPDSLEVRERWAAKFQVRQSDPFTLLRYMGQDAPGSVQVVPEGQIPSMSGSLSKLTPKEISARISAIIVDPEHWVEDSDDDESRFSLGGNQGKFALAQIDGEWYEPNGRAASTHIVKPGMVSASGHTNDEVQAVEFVTMRASRSVKIPTALVDLLDFDGQYGFITRRYDRVTRDGRTKRIHQEDFCQALAILPSRKYEEDGGPTMAEMNNLVRDSVAPRTRGSDTHVLHTLFAFNLLAAGVDAHAKNHSLLLSGNQVRLAPAYDLISAHGLWPEDRVTHKSTAAVKYGKERRYRTLSGRDIARTADVLQVDRKQFVEMLNAMAGDLPAAFEEAVAQLPTELTTDMVLRMPERVKKFAISVSKRATLTDIRDTPQFLASHPGGPRVSTSRDVWVAGHWRNSDWVTGHYRSRPLR